MKTKVDNNLASHKSSKDTDTLTTRRLRISVTAYECDTVHLSPQLNISVTITLSLYHEHVYINYQDTCMHTHFEGSTLSPDNWQMFLAAGLPYQQGQDPLGIVIIP